MVTVANLGLHKEMKITGNGNYMGKHKKYFIYIYPFKIIIVKIIAM